MTTLCLGDIWTPSRENDAHLTRTIIYIYRTDEGLMVDYVGRNGDVGVCRFDNFRAWVSKMKAQRSVDEDFLVSMKEGQ